MEESFKALLHRYNQGLCSPEEQAMVEAWYQQMEAPQLHALSDAQLNELNTPKSIITHKRSKLRPVYKWMSVAAALLLVASAVLYFNKSTERSPNIAPVSSVANDVQPGANKAILTLADGSQISLDQSARGKLAEQGDVTIQKTESGELVYAQAEKSNAQASASMFNTVSTPRGGHYHLVLADGTQVWLNAASSLKYPTAFKGQSREVEVSGEAYFEVAHNPSKPFRVVSTGQTLEVLGTHFNLNAYADEPVAVTTLLEGAVRVWGQRGEGAALLKPGQQSALSSGQKIKVSQADTEAAIDWKEGDFIFENQSLSSIMRKVSRWYDVDVNYDQASSEALTFSGVVSRTRKLSAVLKMLERTGTVRFHVTGKQVIVTSNASK